MEYDTAEGVDEGDLELATYTTTCYALEKPESLQTGTPMAVSSAA